MNVSIRTESNVKGDPDARMETLVLEGSFIFSSD